MLFLAYLLSFQSFGMHNQKNFSLEKRDYSYKKTDTEINLPEITGRKIQRNRKQSFKYQKKLEFPDIKKKISFKDLNEWVNKKIKKQEKAIKEICNVICSHQAFLDGIYFEKMRVLLHGPSGCGKTAIVSEISKKVNMPFFFIDASSLTGAGYKGLNIREAIGAITKECKEKKYNQGEIIIFFDEIDKLFSKNMKSNNNVDAVISELLVFMEKGIAELNFSTERSLIFFAGAFSQVNLEDAQVFSKEFFGRITNLVMIKKLKFDDFKEILKTSTDSPLVKMTELLKKQDRSITITPKAFDWIAKYAEKSGTGARGIKSIMHKVIQPYFGEQKNINEIIINEDVVKEIYNDLVEKIERNNLEIEKVDSLSISVSVSE